MTKSFFFILAFIIAVVACSTDKVSKRELTLIPPHGGVLLKGRDYYVELVSEDDEVSIYTLQELEAGAMKIISTKKSKVYARYSPKKSQANWGLNLRQEDSRYIGEVDPKGENSYQIYLDLKVDGSKEKFSHTIVMDGPKK